MKSRFLRSTALTAFLAVPAMYATQATAAPPVYSWTGFYIGANAGAAWGHSDAKTAASCGPGFFPPNYFCDAVSGLDNAALVNSAGTGKISDTAFTGGIQFGYNWQVSNWVYGIETDFGSFNLRGSRSGRGGYVSDPGFAGLLGQTFTVNSAFSTDWLYTLRGRIGWSFAPNFLAYATGGMALTQLKVSNGFSDNVFPGASESASGSTTKVGWALGGGLEWALTRNWSVKGEYLHVNFGTVTANGTIINPQIVPAYAQGLSTSTDLSANIARIGVNYRF
jgi:outer membrane immunogenic protein